MSGKNQTENLENPPSPPAIISTDTLQLQTVY